MSKKSLSEEDYFEYVKDSSVFHPSELICSICEKKVNINVNFVNVNAKL